jgi:hemerythrin superfamily protein
MSIITDDRALSGLGQGITSVLEADHEEITRQLEAFDALDDVERAAWFDQLRDMLKAHEAAEERTVYPELRTLPGGGVLADTRIGEQREAERKLGELGELDPLSGEFTSQIVVLREAVSAHAKAEEAEVFPMLDDNLEHDVLVELAERYDSAKGREFSATP